jgi:hypothetical protein
MIVEQLSSIAQQVIVEQLSSIVQRVIVEQLPSIVQRLVFSNWEMVGRSMIPKDARHVSGMKQLRTIVLHLQAHRIALNCSARGVGNASDNRSSPRRLAQSPSVRLSFIIAAGGSHVK